MHPTIKATSKAYNFEESNRNALIKTCLLVNNIPAEKLPKQSKRARFLDTTAFLEPISPPPTPTLPFTDIFVLLFNLHSTTKKQKDSNFIKSIILKTIQTQPRICFGLKKQMKVVLFMCLCLCNDTVYTLLSLHRREQRQRGREVLSEKSRLPTTTLINIYSLKNYLTVLFTVCFCLSPLMYF